MKRLDFKAERTLREVLQEKNWVRAFTENLDRQIEDRFNAVEQG